jgi:glucokinase
MIILAGDIGGTKTHLALFENEQMISDQKYVSHVYPSLLEIVRLFLSTHAQKVESACFGVAGPVQNGRCHTTNLPWIIDSHFLSKSLEISNLFLINDLVANAYGITCLGPADFATLNPGTQMHGNRALIAAGTGLGEAGLYWDGKEHHPFACEGGHADFAARDERDVELWRYMKKKNSHVSYERIVSGPGFVEIFYFLIESGSRQRPSWLQADMPDLAKIITEKALQKECELCVDVLNWFVILYGSEAGNVALKFLSVGGLYIGGGIAPKILSALQENQFMHAFKDKGRFENLLSAIPIKVILNENTALLGAAAYSRKKQRMAHE